MAKQKSIGRRVASVISFLLILAALAAIIAVIYRFTNGFNEDFKTFYLECEGEQVLTTNTKRSFLRGETYRYDVKYTFDFGDDEVREYDVKIVPNNDVQFSFSVDNRSQGWQGEDDITSAFNVKKNDTYFELIFAEDLTLSKVCEALYPGHAVVCPNEWDLATPYLYTLVVSSYNERIIYRIDFCFYVPVMGIEPSAKELYF